MGQATKILALCTICVVLLLFGYECNISRMTQKYSMIPKTSRERSKGRVTNIYYLKLGKTGSTTLYTILARYAWKWNLRVATHSINPLAHEPQSFIMDTIIPPFMENKSMKYNMILQHSSYEPSTIAKVLQLPFTHVTMMRNPLSRLESHLRYFDEIRQLQLEQESPAESFINKLDDMNWTQQNEYTLNHFLNYVNRIFNVEKRGIDDVLSDLKKNFFVGITEFYEESLILLRHRLRWGFKDVLYIAAKVQNYKHKVFNREMYGKLCQWIPDECLIYDYFNKSLSQEIMQKNIGKEVKHFKSVIQKIQEFCEPVNKRAVCLRLFNQSKHLVIDQSEWHNQFIYTYDDCFNLSIRGNTFIYLFYFRQNPRGPCPKFSFEDKKSSMRVCNLWDETKGLGTFNIRYICRNYL